VFRHQGTGASHIQANASQTRLAVISVCFQNYVKLPFAGGLDYTPEWRPGKGIDL
jgi:hypothetical protein